MLSSEYTLPSEDPWSQHKLSFSFSICCNYCLAVGWNLVIHDCDISSVLKISISEYRVIFSSVAFFSSGKFTSIVWFPVAYFFLGKVGHCIGVPLSCSACKILNLSHCIFSSCVLLQLLHFDFPLHCVVV